MIPKVVVLVLNWNRKDLTMACLDSLRKVDYVNYVIVVIDNGSTDGSEALIRQQYPECVFIQNGENLGYAEGNNRGFQWALYNGADYVFVINNDVVVDKNCIKYLVEAAEQQTDVGVLGPIAYEYDKPESISAVSYGFDWNLISGYFRTEAVAAAYDHGSYYESDYIHGDAFFVRANVLKTVGLFDPRYFMFYEETDLCFRASEHGYKCRIVKAAKFWRIVNGTIGDNPLKWYYSARNGLLFIRKNAPREMKKDIIYRYLKLRKWDAIDWYLKQWLKSRRSQDAKIAVAIFRGVIDALLGRYGKTCAP